MKFASLSISYSGRWRLVAPTRGYPELSFEVLSVLVHWNSKMSRYVSESENPTQLSEFDALDVLVFEKGNEIVCEMTWAVDMEVMRLTYVHC